MTNELGPGVAPVVWAPGMHTGSDGSVDLAAYDRYLGRWSGLFVPALVEAAGIGRGDRVLDVATGPGDAAIAVRSVAADGQQLPFGNDTFDAVICQLGLMFSAAMWGVLARVLSDHLPDQHKAFHLSFSLADPGTMIELFTRAGYRDVQVQRHVRNSVFESLDDYWEPIERRMGSLPHAYCSLPEPVRRRVHDEVNDLLGAYATAIVSS